MALQSHEMNGDPHLQRAASNLPPLRLGARNSGVRILQECLIKLGYSMLITTNNGSSEPDGIFGQETLKAVQKFQVSQCLSADGIAGRDTLHRLDQLMQAKQEITSPTPLSPTLAGIDQAHWRLCAMWT